MEPQLFRLLMEQYSHIHHFCVHMYYIYFQRPGATKGCLQRPGHIGTDTHVMYPKVFVVIFLHK